jgi:hypothetical protein
MTSGAQVYLTEVGRLANSSTATEASFYPAIKTLLSILLAERGLAFDVRVNTSERREGGGTDLPDVAIYDGRAVNVSNTSGSVFRLTGTGNNNTDVINFICVGN